MIMFFHLMNRPPHPTLRPPLRPASGRLSTPLPFPFRSEPFGPGRRPGGGAPPERDEWREWTVHVGRSSYSRCFACLPHSLRSLMVDSQLRTVCVMIFCGYVETYLSSCSHIIPAVLKCLWRPEGCHLWTLVGLVETQKSDVFRYCGPKYWWLVLLSSTIYIYIYVYIHDVPIKAAFFLVKSPLFITMSSLSSPFPNRLTGLHFHRFLDDACFKHTRSGLEWARDPHEPTMM